MNTDLDDSKVFADELQARGDPRGELLSLELAAGHATTSAEARRLNRDAQRIRDAHPALVWPEALRNTFVGMRAGFVVAAACEHLLDPNVPSELALSVRDLFVFKKPAEVMPKLIHARAHGLALDRFRHGLRPRDRGEPTSLAGLRVLGEGRGRWPAIRALELVGWMEDFDEIGGLTGLESLKMHNEIVGSEQLRSLVGLELKTLHGRWIDLPLLVELFGATLEHLRLDDECEDLVASVHELPALQQLYIPSLDPELIEALRPLRLRELCVKSVPVELLSAFAGLTNVEELDYTDIVGQRVDVTPLLTRPGQRRLKIRSGNPTKLLLPMTIERLEIEQVKDPLAIVGAPISVVVVDGNPACLPPALLLGVRHLELRWSHGAYSEFLAELPQACPSLETLKVVSHLPAWRWTDAPRILAALPHLRKCSLYPRTVGELVEQSRTFPDLDMNDTSTWPRSCGH
jgi:hypothetical protein